MVLKQVSVGWRVGVANVLSIRFLFDNVLEQTCVFMRGLLVLQEMQSRVNVG